MLIIAAPVSNLYKDPRLLQVIVAIAIGTVLTGMSNPKLIVLSRGLVFWQEFATAVTQKLIGFLAAAVIAILFRSYWALVAGVISTQLAGLILSYLVVSYRPRFAVSRFRELFGFSVWISLAQAVNTLNWAVRPFNRWVFSWKYFAWVLLGRGQSISSSNARGYDADCTNLVSCLCVASRRTGEIAGGVPARTILALHGRTSRWVWLRFNSSSTRISCNGREMGTGHFHYRASRWSSCHSNIGFFGSTARHGAWTD